MKQKIYLTLLLLITIAVNMKSQCLNSSMWPFVPIAISGNNVTTISVDQYDFQYAAISGAVSGTQLRFTSSVPTDFLTVRSGTANGPVLGFGQTPLTINNTYTGTVYLHTNADAACGFNGSTRITRVQKIPPATHLNFDGTNDNVTLPANIGNTLSNGTEMTIEYWFKGTNLQSAVRIQNGGEWIVAGWGNGAPQFIVSTDGGTNGVSCGSPATINSDAWHHLAFVWKKNTTFATYLDGVLQNQRVAADVNLPTFSGVIGNIGSFTGTSEFLTGNMDDVRIWNVALSANDIARRRSCELAGNEAGLLAYYKFNQGIPAGDNTSVTALTDATANGYNGQLSSNFALTGTTSNWLAGSPVISGSTIPTAPTAIAQSVCVNRTVANLVPAPSTTIKWYNVATGGSALANATVLASGSYYVAAVNANGCESTRTAVTVTVNSVLPAPTAINPQVYAGTGTVASLSATGTGLQWNSHPSFNAPMPSQLSNEATYYVNQFDSCGASDRTAVTVRKISEASQTFCQLSNPTVANLVSTPTAGASISWFTAPSGGTALASNDALSTGNYYVQQTIPAFSSAITSGLSSPFGIAVQADGKILVADVNNNNIVRTNANGTGAVNFVTGLNFASGVAVQADGKILIADTYNNAIKRVDANGTNLVTLISTGLNYPSAIAVQSDGKIIIADSGNNAIKRIEANGTGIVTLATGFNFPSGVAIQADGKILVADTDNNRLVRIDANGSTPVFLANGIDKIRGVAIQNDGKIIFASANANAIFRIDADGSNLEGLVYGLNRPSGIAIQSSGKIIFTNSATNEVRSITDTNISNRVLVTTSLISTALPIAAAQSFCPSLTPNPTIANLVVTATLPKWYANATGGVALVSTIPLISKIYYVTQTLNGCESARVAVNVSINITPVPTASQLQVYAGTGTIANLTVTGANLKWYENNIGGAALASSTALVDGTTYYVSQTIDGCESMRVAVKVRKIGDGTQTFCKSTTVADLANTPTSGATTSWFAAANGGTALSSTDEVSTGNYFVQQTTSLLHTDILNVNASDVAVLPDGRIVYVDKTNSNNVQIRVKNANDNGSTSLVQGLSYGDIALAVQSDGKIVFAATWSNTFITRINADGTGSTTLGSFVTHSGFSNIAIQPDGKIVFIDTGNGTIKRINADGSGLVVVTSIADSSSYNPIAVLPDGKILVADNSDGNLYRFDANGTNQTTILTGIGGTKMAVQTDGKIVLLDNTVIRRINPDGSNLETFSVPFDATYGMALTANGDVIVSGGTFNGDYKIIKTQLPNISNRAAVGVTVNTTTWNGAWNNGEPSISKGAIFESNFTAATDLTACSLAVNGNAIVNIPSGFDFTVVNSVAVASTASLVFENNSNLLQTAASATNTGNIISKKETSVQRLAYTNWSSPVANQNALAFSPLTTATRFNTYNEVTNVFASMASPSTTNLIPAVGYGIRAPNTFADAPAAATPFVGTFTGIPNNGNYSYPATYTSIANGYNLVGNPYPSTMLASAFFAANPNVTALHFWNNSVLNAPTGTNYATRNLTTGTRAASDINSLKVPTDFIAVGQGFFAKVNAAATLSFTNAMRSSDNTNAFFFRNATTDKHLFKLNLLSPTATHNQIAIGYLAGATTGIDNQYDAVPFAQSPTMVSSLINNNDYVIQGRSLPFSTSDVVPLGFKTDVAGNYSFTTEAFEGVFANNQNIFLKDNLTGTTHNIKQSPYNFTTNAGTFNSRFEIVYQSVLGIENPNFDNNTVFVFVKNDNININSGKKNMKNIQVFDIRGRLVFDKKEVNATAFEIQNLKVEQSVLVVKITSEDGQKVSKKIIF